MAYDIPILPLELGGRQHGTGKPAAKIAAWIDANVMPVTKEDDPLPRSIHQATLRLTWQFFYATRGASAGERSSLTETFLEALDALHDAYLDVEKVDLVEVRTVYAPPPVLRPVEPDATLPRDPEQAALRFDEV